MIVPPDQCADARYLRESEWSGSGFDADGPAEALKKRTLGEYHRQTSLQYAMLYNEVGESICEISRNAMADSRSLIRDRPGLKPVRHDATMPAADWDDAALYPIYTPTMPESDLHCWSLDVLKLNLREHLARTGMENCRLLGNVNLFYREGQRQVYLAPDVMLSLDPPPHVPGQPYRTWVDGIPELVVEVLSPDNWANDVGFKKGEYADMGVQEYWLFDPHELCADIPRFLQGYRLQHGAYTDIASAAAYVENFPTELHFSDVLAAAWGLDDQQRLRVYNAEEGIWYPLEGVEAARRKQAEARAESAEARAESAEAEAQQARAQAESAAAKIACLQRLLQERTGSD